MDNKPTDKGEWVSVEDALPKNHYRVLVWVEDGLMSGRCTIAEITTKGEWYAPFKNIEEVTHWMPLPSPPNK